MGTSRRTQGRMASGTTEGARDPQIEDSGPDGIWHGFTTGPAAPYAGDLLGASLSNPEGDVILATSADSRLVEVYSLDGEVVVRVNRAAHGHGRFVWIDTRKEAALAETIPTPPAPVLLQFTRPTGTEQWMLYDHDDKAPDFGSLSEIERATMATRLRIIADRIEGAR